MDHEYAVLRRAGTRYLLREMNTGEMAEFEEHFFSCAECAAEVASDNVFARTLRQAFLDEAPSAPAKLVETHGWRIWRSRAWWPRFDVRVPLAIAAGFLFAFVIYQNVFVVPALKRNVALLSNPQAPFPVVLQLSRDETSVTTIPKDYVFFNPQFYRALSERLPSYRCDIETGSGTKVKSIVLAPPADGAPFSFKLLRSEFPSGLYRFKLRDPGSSRDLAMYTIVLNTD